MDKPDYDSLRARLLITGCSEAEIREACLDAALKANDKSYINGVLNAGWGGEESFELVPELAGGSGCREVEVLRDVVTDCLRQRKVPPRKIVCSFAFWERVMVYFDLTFPGVRNWRAESRFFGIELVRKLDCADDRVIVVE